APARPCGRGKLAQFSLLQRFAVWWVAPPWPILSVAAVLLALCRLVDKNKTPRRTPLRVGPVSGEGFRGQHITPATKIRTNPSSRFGPATADRGSRGIRDQPRNPPKYTEKRIRINFPFPRRGHTLCRSRRTAASARRPGRSAGESGGTSEPAGSSSRTCKCSN